MLLLLGFMLVAGVMQRRLTRLRPVMAGLLMSYVTVVLLLGMGEAYFRFVYANNDYWWTLAGDNWRNRYVQMNALGYRDRDWLPNDYTAKQTVLVVGDSFTMGDGVANPDERFSDVLAGLLGADYAVLNLGVPDTTTRDHLDLLQAHPVRQPDVVIWQYFLNDINDAAASIGQQYWPNMPVNWPPIVDESYLANYVYWQIAPFITTVDTADKDSFWGWAYGAYDNATIWAIHEEEIRAMVEYVDAIGARLIVIIFPNLRDPVGSIAYVDRVAQAVKAYAPDAGLLPLYSAAADFSENRAESIVVSARDDHPSGAFHQVVGQLIYESFFMN